MNSKAQFSLMLTVGILAIIILFLIVVILSSNVSLSTQINKESVPKGLDITLYYEIENGFWFSDAENIVLEWVILNENKYLEQNGSVSIITLKPLEKKIDNIEINIYSLNRGEYTVWVHLDYWIMGKWETKHLSLQFSVI